MQKVEKRIPAETVSSEFGLTINVGEGNYIKIKSGIVVQEGATDEDIDKALDTWESSFWKQYDRVLDTFLKVKKRFKNE